MSCPALSTKLKFRQGCTALLQPGEGREEEVRGGEGGGGRVRGGGGGGRGKGEEGEGEG